MSTNLISSGTTAREKVNLRTPEVMAAVQAQVESHYRSDIVDKIRAAAAGSSRVGGVTVRLAKQFGFCYGVERAIDLAYAARKVFTDRRLFILGEIIHNPEVNEQISSLGIKNLHRAQQAGGHRGSATGGCGDRARVRHRDVHLAAHQGARLPDRGHDLRRRDECLETRAQIRERIRHFDHPRQGRARGDQGHRSRASATARVIISWCSRWPTRITSAITSGMAATRRLSWRNSGCALAGFRSRSASAHGRRGESDHDDARRDRGSAAPLKGDRDRDGAGAARKNFRFFDTICGATQERQDALARNARCADGLLLVIGGYNSSNTSHLAEMGEEKLPTYFVRNASRCSRTRKFSTSTCTSVAK